MYNINSIIKYKVVRFNNYICFEISPYMNTISIFNMLLSHYIIYYPEHNAFHFSEYKLHIVNYKCNIKIITHDTSIKNSIAILE